MKNKWNFICSLYFVFCHSVYNFLDHQLLAELLNFLFTKVTWKLDCLRCLNVVQEKQLREYTSCLYAK